MYYAILDGDKIGDLLARAYLANDEEGLSQIDVSLRNGLKRVEVLLQEMNFRIITSGADGITLFGYIDSPERLLSAILRELEPYSFSIGVGSTLRDAFVALRYAKACGRGRVAHIMPDGKTVVGAGSNFGE